MSPSSQHPDGLPPDDATLVEWLDGELTSADAEQVARLVRSNQELAERVRLLRSTRAELAWALNESDSAPPPAQLARVRTQTRPNFGKWLLAAAALAIVVAVGSWQPDGEVVSAENDVIAIKLSSPQTCWDLFSNIRFALEGRAKTNTPCRIIARKTDESDEQLAARAVAENDGKPVIPMVLTANLSIGKRDIAGDVAVADGTFGKGSSTVDINLIDVRVHYEGIGPLLTFELNDTGGREDFIWPIRNAVMPRAEGAMGFVPTQVGEYRLTLKLRALATVDGKDPAFAEPLEVGVGFAICGIVGEWSDPVDGMSSRILASRGQAAGQPLAVAIQLRNDSKLPRKFNVTGTTMAEIPQPFHFDLVVDGEKWEQRDDLGVITAAHSLLLPQPVGSTRSLIVLTDYWQHPNQPETKLRGRHQLGMRFNFKPFVWNTTDKGYWIGILDTPPVTITFPSGN